MNTNKCLKEIIDTEDALFHYTKKHIGMEMILKKGYLRLNRLSNTNDPYEYKNKLFSVTGWEWETETKTKINKMHAYAENILEKASYFLSFSENKYNNNKELINKGYQKSRMWSQYGDDHYGMCLIFSKKMIIQTIKGLENKLYTDQGTVCYESNKDHLKAKTILINNDSFNNKSPFEVALDHINKNKKELFFHKINDYKDEDEYRIIMYCKTEKPIYEDNFDINITECIQGIILGDRFPKVYKPSIERLSKNLNIQHKKNHWERGKFTLIDFRDTTIKNLA